MILKNYTGFKYLKDLREYIEELKKIGELKEVNVSVDWNLEVGAIIRRICELEAPSALFNNIKDYENSGFRILGAPACLSNKKGARFSKLAISLGLKPDTSIHEIIDLLVQAHHNPLVPPVKVSSSPCKQNILLGDDVDLYKLPVPYFHDKDGGRYLNTWGIIVAQTPDGSWTNWSIARIMIHGKKTMVGLIASPQHIRVVYDKWKEINKPMPFALAMGVEPIIPIIGGMPIPEKMNEADFIGGLLGEPLKVIDCETVKLQIPASAEIVIEGHISIDKAAMEGPMGEGIGYTRLSDIAEFPLYEVAAITYRNNAILPCVFAGAPIEETGLVWGLGQSMEVKTLLLKHGLPIIKCVTVFETAMQWMVITLDKSYATKYSSLEITKIIGDIVCDAGKIAMTVTSFFIMDDDIDPIDIKQLLWGIATRCSLTKGVISYENKLLAALCINSEKISKSTKMVYNCLRPDMYEGKLMMAKFNIEMNNGFASDIPKGIQAKVIKNWGKYFNN